jgi:guanylate kinase
VPKLIVVSGPSGCGKTTIAQQILKRHPEMTFSISATTRARRANEADGRDYFFISKEDFERRIARGELIEWEQIYGDYYGSLKAEIDRAFREGKSILLDVDVKGALSIKKLYGVQAVIIFIRPPDPETLARRLKNRKTESPETLKVRMERVAMELELAHEFDHTIVNDLLPAAVDLVDAIVSKQV